MKRVEEDVRPELAKRCHLFKARQCYSWPNAMRLTSENNKNEAKSSAHNSNNKLLLSERKKKSL